MLVSPRSRTGTLVALRRDQVALRGVHLYRRDGRDRLGHIKGLCRGEVETRRGRAIYAARFLPETSGEEGSL